MYEFNLPSLEEMRNPRNGGMQMLNMIEKDKFKSALITGVAGSGKTTVSIRRLIRLRNQGKQVIFLTYQRLLAGTVKLPETELSANEGQKSIQTTDVDETARISTFHDWQYRLTHQLFEPPTEEVFDLRISGVLSNEQIEKMGNTELIIDEGQDLPAVVFKVLPKYFKRCLVGADNGQKVHTNGVSAEAIAAALSERYQVFMEQELGQNFRNTYEIYRFARQFLPRTNLNAWNPNIPERLEKYNRRGELPQVVYYSNIQERNADLVKSVGNAIRRGNNVAILCAGIGEVDNIYDVVNEHYSATKVHSGVNPLPPLEGCLITTFISAKGLEFDEAIILQINGRNLNDWTIRQQCYVACTRAKNRLLIYSAELQADFEPNQFAAETYERRTLGTADNTEIVPF